MLYCNTYCVDRTSTSLLFYRECYLCRCRRPLDFYCPSGHVPCWHGFFQVTGPWQNWCDR